MQVDEVRVYDPFMDGKENLPLSLELIVSDVNLDEPSFETTSRGWRLRHYNRLVEFESVNGQDDLDEVAFNAERVLDEPVFPVKARLSTDSKMRDFYLKVSDVRRFLRKFGPRYECVPDPTYAREFKNVWQILDAEYECTVCLRNVKRRGLGQVEPARRVQIGKHLLRPLCKSHESEYNHRSALARHS